MTDFRHLHWQQDGHVATVWLDRPPVNATDPVLYQEIHDFFTHVDEHIPGSRAVVLAGRGKHFCGGNDLATFATLSPDNAPEQLRLARDAFWAIYDAPLPVIAAVHGVAVGSGLAIAASCDLVVAAEGARFATPEVNVGVLGGAKHLSRLVPQGMVRLMHYTGDFYPAERLLPYGGIVEIVPQDRLLDAAQALAASIARHSPVTLRLAKRSLNGIEYLDLKTGYRFEQEQTQELSGHADSKEALNAFLEHRPPRYAGDDRG